MTDEEQQVRGKDSVVVLNAQRCSFTSPARAIITRGPRFVHRSLAKVIIPSHTRGPHPQVLIWLKNKGYTQAAQLYEEEKVGTGPAASGGAAIEGQAGSAPRRGSLEGQQGQANGLLFRSVQLVSGL